MDRKGFITAILILAFSSFAAILFYMPGRVEDVETERVLGFPKEIGEWRAEDVPLAKKAYRQFSAKNLISRNYVHKSKDSLRLYIVYSPDNRQISYPPEILYQGRGSTITYSHPVKLTSTIQATSLIIEKTASRELLVYWYKIANIHTNSYLKQQFQAALNKTLGRKKSVALIRILSKIEADKDEEALVRIKAFCVLIEPLFEKYIP